MDDLSRDLYAVDIELTVVVYVVDAYGYKVKRD